MRPNNARHESFIVRLSAELEGEGTSARWVWRGEIEHTLTGQLWRFVSLDESRSNPPRAKRVKRMLWLGAPALIGFTILLVIHFFI
jgi:hypothetical protein